MSDQDTHADGDDWGSSSVVVAGVLLVTILLVAAWLLWPGGDPDGEATAATTPSTTTTESEPKAPGSDEHDEFGCPVDLPTAGRIPASPPQVAWAIYRGVVVPSSEDHGPTVVEGGVARCYSHTPTGALIASVQIGARYVVAPDGVTVAREQTVAGKGQDALVAALEERGVVTVTAGEMCQVAGYRFVTYAPEQAVIARAARCPDGSLQLTQLTLEWHDGDWRIVLLADGSESATASTLSDLSGMTPWSGV
jgi:hypothetical protein